MKRFLVITGIGLITMILRSDYVYSGEFFVPSFVAHNVPFVIQAPFDNWGGVFQNACEEASMLMVLQIHKPLFLSPIDIKKQITAFVDYENQHEISSSMSVVTVQYLLQLFFSIESHLVENPTLDVMKRQLVDGVLIAPMSGEILANPQFRRPFPPYHMLVITGYDDAKKEFIVNDPGTKLGENYRYSYATIVNALHDWTGSRETIISGARRLLFVPL